MEKDFGCADCGRHGVCVQVVSSVSWTFSCRITCDRESVTAGRVAHWRRTGAASARTGARRRPLCGEEVYKRVDLGARLRSCADATLRGTLTVQGRSGRPGQIAASALYCVRHRVHRRSHHRDDDSFQKPDDHRRFVRSSARQSQRASL